MKTAKIFQIILKKKKIFISFNLKLKFQIKIIYKLKILIKIEKLTEIKVKE